MKATHGKGRVDRSRTIGRAVALFVFLPALLAFGGCAESKHSSIVLVTIDTLRADRLGCYGYFRDTSPALDRLAAESVLFENALSVMGTTLPAHVSLMTSTGTLSHGIKSNYQPFGITPGRSDRFLALAEILKRLDYETAAFVSSTPLKAHWGLAVGFDHFSEPGAARRTAEQTTELVLKWLDHRPTQPFFLWVHYFDPHWDYAPPERYKRQFRSNPLQIATLERLGIDSKNRGIVELNNFYDGEVRYVDDQLDRLFARIREMEIWEETAVVVTADHGEGLGQHDWMNHGYIYNEQLFIPLIMKLPSERAVEGARNRRLASILDVVPTLIRNLELPIDPTVASQFEGIDLFDERAERDYLFAERTQAHYSTHGNPNATDDPLDWRQKRHYALTNTQWKYLRRTDAEDALYDMRNDRVEMFNLIGEHPEIAGELKGRILDMVAAGAKNESADTGAVPAELEEELRALGYVR